MSTDTSSSAVGDDNRLQETIVGSIKLIFESQQAILRKIEACNEASNARVEASSANIATLLGKVVECQTNNNQQMMDMLLKILTKRNNSICAGIANEAGKSLSEDDDKEDNSGGGDDDDDDDTDEVLENKSSENNTQQEQTDDQVYNFGGYEPLLEAIRADDWRKATAYLCNHQTTIREIFQTRDSRNEIFAVLTSALHQHRSVFLEEIVKLAPPETLEYLDPESGMTILHFAAYFGNIKAVRALVEKNSSLTQIWSVTETAPVLPLMLASGNVTVGQKEVLEYLCSVTRDGDPSPFSGDHGAILMMKLIKSDMYGPALSICRRFPRMLSGKHGLGILRCSLTTIVERPFAFLSGAKLTWWERQIYSLIEVNMDCTRDYGFEEDHEEKLLETKLGTKHDEENPSETSKLVSSIRERSSASNIRTMAKCIFMGCIRQVPGIKDLYNQKLMHKQVVALIKCFLRHIYLNETLDKLKIKDFFFTSTILEMALKSGTTEFVLESLRVFPFLCTDSGPGDVGRCLLKLVAIERNEMIYNFVCTLKQRKQYAGLSMLDDSNNSVLHFSAELAHSRHLNHVSGAAFQMQREIQWFKGVENTMLRTDRFIRNFDGDTAQHLFTEKHKELMKEGERWMKDTSGSCMVVAALIATVAFAAAFTVPGGNVSDSSSSNNGLPVLLNTKLFMVFAMADAVALFSSVTSVLMFLAVFTSRYSEEDFLKSLPQKLIIGLAALFISMATILVTFGVTFTIVLVQRSAWAPILIALLGCAPVLLFGFLQFPLFIEMVMSTYWPIILGKEDHLEAYLEGLE